MTEQRLAETNSNAAKTLANVALFAGLSANELAFVVQRAVFAEVFARRVCVR